MSYNSVLQALTLQKVFRALYFGFTKSELACLFNGAGDIKMFWLEFNHFC